MFNQKINNNFNKQIAECVGLWLAEGDKKTHREVTFTNNSIELILFFHDNINLLYNGYNRPRLYIYSPADRVLISNINGLVVRNYTDKRANRTYYIYRLADTKFVKSWKRAVQLIKSNKGLYLYILRGIFAGEGNVKHDYENHNTRQLRISSGIKDGFIEKLLYYFKIEFKYDKEKREYWLFGRCMDILNEIGIASLHPEKEAKFRKMINSVKEPHYSPGKLKELLLDNLNKFRRTSELANKLKRSEFRILEVLRELKNEGKVDWIKMRGYTYWVKKQIKDKYLYNEKVHILKYIKNKKNITFIANSFNLSRKAIRNKLIKLNKESIVEKEGDRWVLKEKGKTLLGVDEAGREL